MALGGANGKNPFFDIDDDVDDNTFINYGRQNNRNSEYDAYQEKQQRLLEERRQIEDRILEGSKSALSAVYEAEQAGLSAANELVRQGEQLRNIDRNLDEVNATMKVTQRHLTSMKSVFSGLLNRMGKQTSVEAPKKTVDRQPSALAVAAKEIEAKSEQARINNHPALKKSIDTSGFGAALDDDDEYGTETKSLPQKPPMSRSELVEQKYNENLGQLSSGMSNLKVLAQQLGNELDDQLEVMNGMEDKMDKADQSIKFQNSQINRLLKK